MRERTGRGGLRREASLFAAAWLIATVIWIIARLGDLESERVLVPVRVENIPPNVNLQFLPTNIPVVVAFPQSLRSQVVPQNFEVRLDLAEVFAGDPRTWAGRESPEVGQARVSLDRVHTLNLPQSVRVTDLGQTRVQFEASLVTQLVPVRVETAGEPPANHELRDEPRADPSQVLVTGSPEALRRLAEPGSSIPVRPISLEGRSRDFVEYPELRMPQGVELVDPTVRVQVSVGVREKERSVELAEVPIRVQTFQKGLEARATPETAMVRVKARHSVLARVVPSMIAFAPREPLVEKVGEKRTIELDASISPDAPEEIRLNATIEEFSPRTVEIEFVETK